MIKKHFLFLIGLCLIIISCSHADDEVTSDEPLLAATTTVNKDSTAPPKITTLGTPHVIPAPSPQIVPLKYPFGIGRPFVVNYNVGDGLPQNLIFTVAVDKQGNLWSGGLGFLSKFDGSHFTHYNMANGMGSGFVNRILVGDDNRIWVGNFDGLFWFDGNVFHPTPLSGFDQELDVRDIYQDKKGAIWVASGKGLYKIVGDSMTRFAEKQGLPEEFVWNVCTNKEGKILVSTRKGIFVLDGEIFVPYTVIPVIKGKVPNIVGKDKKENLWFIRKHAQDENYDLIRYDGKVEKTYSVKEGFDVDNSINKIIEDRNGILWMTSFNKGLISFDGQRFMYYTASDGLASNATYSLAEDDAGNIWIASTNGISLLSYSYMNNLEKIAEGEVFNDMFTTGKDGTKWVLERRRNSFRLINYREKDALDYNLDFLNIKTSVGSMFTDREGNIWMTVWGYTEPTKLIKFDRKSFSVFGKEQGITISQSANILEDSENNFWLSGKGGVLKLDRNSITHYGTAQGFPETVSNFFIDSKGQYWMTDKDTSICKFDGTYVTHYNKSGVPNYYFINSISEDPFGNIWFAADLGAILFNGKQFKKFGPREGLDNLVSDISMDTSRRLIWFSTITGLTAVAFDKIDSAGFFFQTYSQRNGFDVISGFTQKNQNPFDTLGIWGSGLNGIYRFDYDKVRQFKEPVLQLTHIRIDNQEVVWSLHSKTGHKIRDSLRLLNEAVLKFGHSLDASIKKEQSAYQNVSFDSLQKDGFIPVNLKLPYKNNSITFQFVSVSPSFGRYTQYRYKLEGYEDNWSPYSTKDEAFFGNISEGSYHFRLQAISSTGAQSELNYHFRVLPPWYRTWWAYSLYALLFITGVYAFIRWRTKALQKEKLILEHKVNVRTNELKESLDSLKATQSQLIQSEKMASLGELTAGIAHEIQNPLNFVNNFSEVSNELINEMNDELSKGDIEEAKAIASDIKQNLEKINHHGKRADSIVKGMLQHSRSSNGVKEPTDINALCDEYLRLSYHGLRAKDKSFNASIKTEFDETIGNIGIIPQDIGRVVLNLINNAFYAVDEKAKQNIEGYEPTIEVSTKKEGNKALVSVKDNGNGIPQKVLDKIFQPFFTTKPTGQGTGLGLSLSYDIVKAHSGEINVESRDGDGTTFIIQLPIT